MNFSFKSLFAILSLSPQRFHNYFYLRIVSWQYQVILNHSDTCAVLAVCNAVGLLILLKRCPAFIFPQLPMTKGSRVIYTYTCSLMFSIDVVASAPDDPCIC